MKTDTIYITVRLDVALEKDVDIKDVEEDIISEMDYNFEYDKGQASIVDAEICGVNI
jgi:hypothetical protein